MLVASFSARLDKSRFVQDQCIREKTAQSGQRPEFPCCAGAIGSRPTGVIVICCELRGRDDILPNRGVILILRQTG